MDGFEVLRTLESRRQSQAWVPRVVVLSGHSEPHLLEELQKLGAHDVLVKPLHIDQILGCVEGLAPKPESTEGRPWGQPLKKLLGAPLNLG